MVKPTFGGFDEAMVEKAMPRKEYPHDCAQCGNRCKSSWDTSLRGEMRHFCSINCLKERLKACA